MIVGLVALADIGNAGSDQGACRILAARHAQPARAGGRRVDVGAVALLGPEQLVGDRLVDHAGDDLAVALQPDRNVEMRHAVHEVVGAVERIDDPAVAAVALGLAEFFAEEAVFRPRALELLAERALGHDVGAADEIAGTLLRDLQVLDLAEIALQSLGRGEGGADHHRNGGRAYRQRFALARRRTLAARIERGATDTGYRRAIPWRTRGRKGHSINPLSVPCSCRPRC